MTRILKSGAPETKTSKGFKEFTFIGNTTIETPNNCTYQLSLYPNSNYLIDADPGKSLLVMEIGGKKSIVRQLNSLNFKLGQQLELVNKTLNGSVIVNLDDRLIGMGAEIAQNIIVTLAN